MSAPIAWNELSRSHQRVLARIFGGGTTRRQDPSVVIGLHLMGYMQDQKLSAKGEELCRQALAATVQRVADAAFLDPGVPTASGEQRPAASY